MNLIEDRLEYKRNKRIINENMKTTWRNLITEEMNRTHDSWGNVVSTTLSDDVMDQTFDSGYGNSNGAEFTLWTNERVYFPVVYDGAEWCTSVARNPDGVATRHVGGQ